MATIVAVVALVIGVLVPTGAAVASPTIGTAASVSTSVAGGVDAGIRPLTLVGFDAGNIISDAVFTNKNTMTEAQIQSFFNGKVAKCQGGSDKYGPIICLKDFTITSVNRPADSYCQGYTGAANETAARIIYRVAQSCGINPQVLIVMLQKEQGLVTHTWPSMNRYNAALGQGCPDGGVACDPNYVGFFHQIYGAARQMNIYMEGRYFTYYAPGKTWNIQYNPNRSCGTAPVYVANKATAALYYYTPYLPNAAALAAGYGEGDACSAYGNRNFYNYFTDWFGSTKTAGVTAQVLKDSSTGATYLVTQGKKYSFPTTERAVQFTWIAPAQTVSTTQLATYQDAGPAPRAVRTDAGHAYLLDSGRRIWIPSCARATDYGWNCMALPLIGQGQVSLYGDGGTLEPSITGLGSSWLIQGGIRRETPDRSLLLQFGITSGATAVSDAMTSEYAVGDPVLGAGVFADGAGAMRALLQNGLVYDVPSSAQVPALSTAAKRVSKDTWARLKSSGNLPLAVNSGGRSYVLSVDGWLQVDAYRSLVSFSTINAGSMAGMPSAGAVLGPHFVRTQSGVQVFLISGGTIQTATPEQQRTISATFGVSPTVRVVADGVLSDRVAPAQRMVRTADGTAYLLDGTNRFRFRDCAHVADWGATCSQLATATASEVSQYTDRGLLERLVRQSDGTTWLIQSGTRREVVDTGVLAPFGIGGATSAVSSTFLKTLAAGLPVLGPGTYTDASGGYLLVNQAGTFRVPSGAQVEIVTQSARKLTAESIALLPPRADLGTRVLSDGRSLVLTDQGWLQVAPELYGGAKAFTSADPGSWTGIPVASTETRPHFVRDRTTTQTFLVSGGTLQPVDGDSSRAWLASYFGLSSRLWSVAEGALRGVALPSGLVFKTTDSKLNITDGTTSYRLSDCAVVAAFGKDCTALPTVKTDTLGLKDGGVIGALVRGPAGDVWLIQSATRREVPDPSVLAAYGIGSASVAVSSELLKTVPLGDPVIREGTYRSPSGAIKLIVGAEVVEIPAAAKVDAITTTAKPMTEESFALFKPTGTLPVRAVSAGVTYILSAQGWAKVDATNYGALTFSNVSPNVIRVLPLAPAATGARFVREASSSQVYLASGGLTPMTSEQQTWASATYGVPSAVVVFADGALR